MLTRLLLAEGYVNNTLTEKERKEAEQFPVVMSQVEYLRTIKGKKGQSKTSKKRGAKKDA